MSKTLKSIQTFFKVARIVSIVLFVLGIVGAAGCLLSMLLLIAFNGAQSLGILNSFVDLEEGFSFASGCFACVSGIISCVGVIVMYAFTRKYCERELADGTPFTYDGAKALFRLGLVFIITPIAMSALIGFAWGMCWIFDPTMVEPTDLSGDITTGLFMLVTSYIFKHGTELREQKLAAEVELECLKAETKANAEAEAEAENESESEKAPADEITE